MALRLFAVLAMISTALFFVASCADGAAGTDAGVDAASDDGASDGGGDQAMDGNDGGTDDGGGEDAGADGDGAGGDSADGDIMNDAGDEPADGSDGGGDSGGDQAGDLDCSPEPFDYSCDPEIPETCPGGFCVLGNCIAPVLDPDRWEACGDGSCDPAACETAANCPVDCGQAPEMSGEKDYDNQTTITVWVHGFYNKSPEDIESMVYGQDENCSGILGKLAEYGIDRPCGAGAPGDTAPDQLAKLEYYGAIPAGWLSADDIAEIEQHPYDGPEALDRYALIVAKYIRHKLDVSGATHVNLACHSMGCLISRHMLENDIEGLASENRFVRWFTSAGVIGGARLARLYDNPEVRDAAPMLGLELSDFVIMHPDFVQDRTCVWDHRLHEGNNPLLGHMIIHHAGACDPHIQEALGIALLDLNNPGDEPNDGIMYTDDEFFHRQDPAIALTSTGGVTIQPALNIVYVDHMTLPDSEAAAAMAAATLFHRRKVVIRLAWVELLQDREHHDALDGEHGEAPADIIVETQVRYPFLQAQFGKDVLLHDSQIEYRTPPMFTQDAGTQLDPDLVIFSAPVFDGMQDVQMRFKLLEADWYPRVEVREWVFDAHERLIERDLLIPLVDDSISLESEYARIQIAVEVHDLY
ncbi:MAG: hypothetical protein JXR96_22950 [Deltaproteobacteria bacterium]|nr:hypothetical protein [Deltaproteobacteria bacterium]